LINIASGKAIPIFCVLSLHLITPALGAEVALQWNANIEPDLLGYKVYYHGGSSAPPYTGWTANEGDSPVVVYADDVTMDDVCRYMLTGLQDDETYYFALSAFDCQGNESVYSNQACLKCENHSVGSYSDVVDSEGGGGCLIATLVYDQ